jgi:hypothetical protein
MIGLAACSGSVELGSGGSGGGGGPEDGAGGAGGAMTSSATGTVSVTTATGLTSSTTTGAGIGDACNLAVQSCPDGESCYPTPAGGVCAPTGAGAAWTQCEKSEDCAEGLFCNPWNFMHCVPLCALNGDDCASNEVCFQDEGAELPEGWGFCYMP